MGVQKDPVLDQLVCDGLKEPAPTAHVLAKHLRPGSPLTFSAPAPNPGSEREGPASRSRRPSRRFRLSVLLPDPPARALYLDVSLHNPRSTVTHGVPGARAAPRLAHSSPEKSGWLATPRAARSLCPAQRPRPTLPRLSHAGTGLAQGPTRPPTPQTRRPAHSPEPGPPRSALSAPLEVPCTLRPSAPTPSDLLSLLLPGTPLELAVPGPSGTLPHTCPDPSRKLPSDVLSRSLSGSLLRRYAVQDPPSRGSLSSNPLSRTVSASPLRLTAPCSS